MPVDVLSVAAAALAQPVVSAQVTTRRPVAYDPFLAGRGVERVTGLARMPSGATARWSAVVKRTAGTGARAARREAAAYRLGVAASGSPDALTAPAMLAVADDGDVVELWLQPLTDGYAGRWPLERYGAAAAHIANWDAQDRKVPRCNGFDTEDGWAERHGQPDRLGEAADQLAALRAEPGARELMALLPDDGFRRTGEMVATTRRRIARLAELPQVLLHHDLVRSNLFALDGGRTAAIDWENVGHGPPGVDLAPLVSGSVRRGDASADDLAALEDLVLTRYTEAWCVARPGTSAAEVRTAYRLALGLRWHVVLGTIGAWVDLGTVGMRGSRRDEPRDESLRHLVALSRFLLDAAEESR